MMRFLFFILLALSGCGESPLFNHDNEDNGPFGNTVFSGRDIYKFRKSHFLFTLDWDEAPRLGENKFVIRTWNKDRGTAQGPYEDTPGDLVVFLWMPAMGHGSAPVEIRHLGSGETEVSNVVFIMGGSWQVKFQLKKNGKVIDESVVTYRL